MANVPTPNMTTVSIDESPTPTKVDTRKNDDPEGSSTFKSLIRVFAYGSPREYILQAIGLTAAIASGVSLAMVNVVIGRFISLLSDFSITGSAPEGFLPAVRTTALYFVYIGIVRFVSTYIYASLLTYVAYHLTRNVRRSYLKAALSQEIAFFDRGIAGSIAMQATSNGKLIQSGIAEKLGIFVQAIATFVAAFVIAFISQWKLTLILICLVPALLLTVGAMSVPDAKIETRILKIQAQAGGYAESIFSGIRTVHAFSLQSRVVAKFDKYLQIVYKQGKKKNILYGIMFGGEYFIMIAGMGLAFWQGIGMIARGEVPNIGKVFTVLMSIIIAAGTISTIAPHFVVFGRAASAAAELFALIDRESDINPFDESGHKPEKPTGVISLQGIQFSYPTRPNVSVLQDFSLDIPAGKATALVGPSGSGKSTIIGLLERWYNPNFGTIELDGQDIKDLNISWLRTNVRLVQQEPVLFNGTVFENIINGLVGTPWENSPHDEQMARVQSAAKTAFAHDFIMALPLGYNTRVGERGGLLSGGQKQRIAIARSIISEPKILLLDEATSALDPHAETIVQQALDSASKNRTTVVIAHKLATIRNADNIVVMSKGRIMEQGQHDQLVNADGIYATLVRAQDLSPSVNKDGGKKIGDEDDSTTDDEVQPVQSLAKIHTTEAPQAEHLKNREDHDLYKQLGLIHSVWRLMLSSPELRPWYIITLLACAAGAAVYPGQAVLLGKTMGIFSSPNIVSRGNFISLMFFVLGLGCFVVYFILGWATNVIAQTLNIKLRTEMFDFILRQDLRFFDRPENTVGALISRLDSYPQAVLELMGFNIALVVLSAINVTASSVLALVVSWKLGLVGVFAGMPPMLLSGYARIRLETKMDADMGKRFSASSSVASETVTAIRTVSSLAIEERVLTKYSNELDMAIEQTAPSMFHMMIWFSLTQSVEYFILALGFWWGSTLIHRGEINFYQFMVSFMGVYFSGQASGQMFSFASSFTKANQAANYYFWLSELLPTIRETDSNREKAPSHDCSSYEFKNAQFAYPLAPNNRVLKGVSLEIHPGEFVAFVGASGCGKSTMISLLERFYDPTSGTITVDSAPLSSINPWSYRSRIALVQQEPMLFPGTIRENISQGMDIGASEQIPDSVLEEACRAANAWDFVSSLPEGLNTDCGTGGSQFSGGQRQRIAIARALVRKPNVILLDEATSALDTESERVVQAALMDAATTGDRITIAVAHRLSTVREANRIFVFYGGRIVEAGTHGELIEQGGLYAKMCEAQKLDRSA